MCVGSISGFSCVTHSYRIADNKATVSFFCGNKTACVNYSNQQHNPYMNFHLFTNFMPMKCICDMKLITTENKVHVFIVIHIREAWVIFTLMFTVFINILSYCDMHCRQHFKAS